MSILRGPRRGALRPDEFPGLTCWLRDSYVDSGGAVSQWTDKSGNGFHATQSNASAKPTVSTDAGINNHELFTFDGAAGTYDNRDSLVLPAKSSLITSTAFTIYAVVKTGTATKNSGTNIGDSNSILTDNTTVGVNADFAVTRGASASLVAWNGTFAALAYSNTTTYSNSTWTRFAVSYDGTKAYCRAAGGSDAGRAAGDVTNMSNVLRIGGIYPGNQNPAVSYVGDIAELVFYNQYHSVAWQDMMFAYQAGYFGI